MRSERVAVYLTEDEKALIEEAAWRRGVNRGEWTRSVLLATARQTIEATGDSKPKHPKLKGRRLLGETTSLLLIVSVLSLVPAPTLMATHREGVPVLQAVDDWLHLPEPR